MTPLEIALVVSNLITLLIIWSMNRSVRVIARRNVEYMEMVLRLRSGNERLSMEREMYRAGFTQEAIDAHFRIQAEMNAASMDHSHNGGNKIG